MHKCYKFNPERYYVFSVAYEWVIYFIYSFLLKFNK